MTAQANARLISSLKTFSRAASAAVVLVGGLVLIGWALDITALKSILPGLETMKANSALGFIFAGVSLGLLCLEPPQPAPQTHRRIAQACAVVVALVGLLTLGEYLFGWNLGIDGLLFKETAVD